MFLFLLLLVKNNNVTDSKSVSSILLIIDTMHMDFLIVFIQNTGCRHNNFSNHYWYKKFLLIELRENSCIHSPIFHNHSGLLAELEMSEAVDLSLSQISILI